MKYISYYVTWASLLRRFFGSLLRLWYRFFLQWFFPDPRYLRGCDSHSQIYICFIWNEPDLSILFYQLLLCSKSAPCLNEKFEIDSVARIGFFYRHHLQLSVMFPIHSVMVRHSNALAMGFEIWNLFENIIGKHLYSLDYNTCCYCSYEECDAKMLELKIVCCLFYEIKKEVETFSTLRKRWWLLTLLTKLIISSKKLRDSFFSLSHFLDESIDYTYVSTMR